MIVKGVFWSDAVRYKNLFCQYLFVGLLLIFVSPVLPFSLTGMAGGIAAKVKPIVGFFTNFTKAFLEALKNADYNEQTVMVYSAPPSQQEASSGQTQYAIGYDLGFRGGGDIEQPYSFAFDAIGRYRYTPVTAMLFPGVIPDITDPTGTKKKPLSLGDGFAPELIKGLLSVFVGGRSNADKIWSPVGYFLTVSPESILLLKPIMLLNTARRNTQLARGLKGKYPTLVDVPYELMMLLFRLVITPDIDATKKLNDDFGPDKAVRWERVVTLSRPSRVLAKMPSFFVQLLNSFKPSVDAKEIEEYRDRFASPISDMQILYSDVRKQRPYEVRIDYQKNNVIEKVDIKKMNPTDVDLLEYMVRQTISERYRGLKTFVTSIEFGSTVVTDAQGNTDSSTDSRATDDVSLLAIDVTRMTDFLAKRIPKIKEFITYLLSPIKKDMWSQDLQTYLGAVVATLDTEFADLQKMAVDLTDARKAFVQAKIDANGMLSDADPARILEQRISQLIVDKLDAIQAQEATQLGKLSGRKTPVPLPAYLDIKFWQTMRVMRQMFEGDKNYLLDDSSLSLPKALLQAYAICFRANLDLLYLEDLVKTDPRPFVVKNQQGETMKASGVELYKSYMDAERYLLYCQQKVTSYRNSLGKMTPQQLKEDQQLQVLQKDADNSSILFGRARSAFRYFLRQFEFDRRYPRSKHVGKVMLGDASLEGLGDVNVIQVPQAAATQVASATQPAAASTTVTAVPATSEVVATKPEKPVVDDPFAVFGGAVTGVTSPGEVSDGSTDLTSSEPQDQDFVNPVFDDGGAAGGAQKSAQKGFLGLTPEKYEYKRSVNTFLIQEFARLILRCPDFQEHAQGQLDQMVFQMTGMRVNQLLQGASGEASDVEKEQDASMLPGDDFFTQKLSMDSIGSASSSEDMDALGQELSAKYGLEGTDSSTADGELAVEEPGSSDSDTNSDTGGSSVDLTAQEPVEGVSDAFDSLMQEPMDVSLNSQDSLVSEEVAPVEDTILSGVSSAEPSNQNVSTEPGAFADQSQNQSSFESSGVIEDASTPVDQALSESPIQMEQPTFPVDQTQNNFAEPQADQFGAQGGFMDGSSDQFGDQGSFVDTSSGQFFGQGDQAGQFQDQQGQFQDQQGQFQEQAGQSQDQFGFNDGQVQ